MIDLNGDVAGPVVGAALREGVRPAGITAMRQYMVVARPFIKYAMRAKEEVILSA